MKPVKTVKTISLLELSDSKHSTATKALIDLESVYDSMATAAAYAN